MAEVENVLIVRRGDGAMLLNMPAEKETHSMTGSSPSRLAKKFLISPVLAMEKLTSTVWEVHVRMMITAMWIMMPTVQISNITMENLYQKKPVKV